MASLKEIRQHIVAVRQTQKLTKAMNMVAAARLRSTQSKAETYQEYAEETERLLAEIGKRTPMVAERLYTPQKDSDKVLLVVFTSDRGLCGSFNFNVFQKTDKAILEIRERGLRPTLLIIGRKGRDYYRRRRVDVVNVRLSDRDAAGKDGTLKSGFRFGVARKLTRCLIDCYQTGFKEVRIVYTSFGGVNRRPAEIIPFLPIGAAAPEGAEKGGEGAPPEAPETAASAPEALDEPFAEKAKAAQLATLDYNVEPDPEDLLKVLVPNSLATVLFRASLDSVTAENAARMQAMDNATRSCADIIQSLQMTFNKARQAAVTNELLDIVNGAEALKG